MRLLEAAVEAQVHITVFIDNLGVQQGLRDCIRGVTRKRAWAFADWRQIGEWVRRLPRCEAHWVPSHGKRPDWTAPQATML